MVFYKIFGYTLNSEDGYSLTELLIVLTLTGMIIAFVSSVYLFAEESLNRWMQSIKLENELHILLHGMANDIYRAEILNEISSHSLILVMPGDTTRTYERVEDVLQRDGLVIHSERTKVVNLFFRPEGENISRNNSAETGSITPPGDIAFIRMELALTNGTDTLASRRAVHLRRPQTWKSLKEE